VDDDIVLKISRRSADREKELQKIANTYGRILDDHPKVGINFFNWHKTKYRTAFLLNALISHFGMLRVIFLPSTDDLAFRYPTHEITLKSECDNQGLTAWLTNFVAGALELGQDEYQLIVYKEPHDKIIPGSKYRYKTVRLTDNLDS